ncbi:MAG: HNH endonuclease [Selenomonadaceae bacterium]|nr:HNH endonuclease [Selenomonadaceae bacterium]
MKHKEKLFELLRTCAETPQESLAVEEMIRKVEGDMPPIETVSDTQKKFAGLKFYKKKGTNYCCAVSLHRFVWQYFNGEIPEDCDIHHRDFNHDNNDIANLELVTKDEHKRIHAAVKKQKSPPKKSVFVCVVCGKNFQAVNRGNNSYCSEECRHRSKLETRICEICGKEFSALINGDQRFCSETCYYQYRRRRETKKCPVCGKEFKTSPSRKKIYCSSKCFASTVTLRESRTCAYCGKEFSARINGDQRFCSDECSRNARRVRETKHCPICGKVFSTVKSRGSKYCSPECYHESRRKK